MGTLPSLPYDKSSPVFVIKIYVCVFGEKWYRQKSCWWNLGEIDSRLKNRSTTWNLKELKRKVLLSWKSVIVGTRIRDSIVRQVSISSTFSHMPFHTFLFCTFTCACIFWQKETGEKLLVKCCWILLQDGGCRTGKHRHLFPEKNHAPDKAIL